LTSVCDWKRIGNRGERETTKSLRRKNLRSRTRRKGHVGEEQEKKGRKKKREGGGKNSVRKKRVAVRKKGCLDGGGKKGAGEERGVRRNTQERGNKGCNQRSRSTYIGATKETCHSKEVSYRLKKLYGRKPPQK